jgi:FecR protein
MMKNAGDFEKCLRGEMSETELGHLLDRMRRDDACVLEFIRYSIEWQAIREKSSALRGLSRVCSESMGVECLGEKSKFPMNRRFFGRKFDRDVSSSSLRGRLIWVTGVVVAASLAFLLYVPGIQKIPIDSVESDGVNVAKIITFDGSSVLVGELGIESGVIGTIKNGQNIYVQRGIAKIYFEDGTEFSLEESSRVKVLNTNEGLRIGIESGTLDAKVAHQIEGRHVEITAGGMNVIVVGTEFRVHVDDESSSVVVRSGVVKCSGVTRGPQMMVGTGEEAEIKGGSEIHVGKSVGSDFVASSPVRVPCVANAMVRTGSDFQDVNFGSQRAVSIKRRHTGHLTREAYFQFKIPNGVTLLQSAILQLSQIRKGPSVPFYIAADLLFDQWDERTITYRNRPTDGKCVALWQSLAEPGDIKVDVTHAVREALANGTSELTFRIHSTIEDRWDAEVDYSTWERRQGEAPCLQLYINKSNGVK